MPTSDVSVLPRVVHAIAPYTGDSPLARRQELFLESVDRADRDGCALLAGVSGHWSRQGWTTRPLRRDASVFGEPSSKPFLKDLLDLAISTAGPGDWIFYSNIDCAITPDLYADLRRRRATVVEYQRRDVLGDPQSLAELFANPRMAYPLGLDALAIRAHYYEEIRDRLPDFVIGEPHWDTIYSGILRRLVPVRRDSSRLLHPKHAQAWDLGHPTAAGRHNHDLFVESLEHGDSEKTTIAPDPDQTDTAIVTIVFGSDPARVKANVEGIRQQLRQDLDADYYLVEMLNGDGTSSYPDDLLASVQHVPVRGGEAAEELFQKEALQNVGWRAALARHPYEYLIFPDADVYADDLGWFRRIRDRLRQDPSRAVHGYRTVRDSIDPDLHYCSLGASFVFNQPNDLPLNPGICWGLHRELLEAGDGFNPFCFGAGDSAFVAEYLNTAAVQYDPWLEQWTWFKEVQRELPFYAGLDCVETDLVHVHHGYAVKRNYDGYRYAVDALPPLAEFIHLTDAGILAWNDPHGVERRLLREQRHMHSRAEVEDLLTRHGVSRHVRPARPTAEPAEPRPYFRPRAAGDAARRAPTVHHGAHRTGLKIFDPDQVFRRDFPFSWCDGVAKPAGSTYVPIVDGDEFALLRLDGLPGTPYVVGALPLQPNWQPHDVHGYGALAFLMRLSGSAPADLRVTLTSITADGREPESQPVPLGAGTQAGVWTPVSIALSSFTGEGFDLGGVRLVKFAGSGCFCLELAEIYLVCRDDA